MADLAPAVVDTVMRVIADIDPDHLNDREVIAFLAGISETTTGLLQAKPDLKAHADLVMDLANRVFHANKAAEERGYRKAIADLRNDELADRIAEATAEHYIVTGRTDANGNNPCVCGRWWDSEHTEGWDEHMASVSLAVVTSWLESRLSSDTEGPKT